MTTEAQHDTEPPVGIPAEVGDEEAVRAAEQVDAALALELARLGLGWISHT